MLKVTHVCKLLATGAALAIIGTTAAPATAGEIIIINRNRGGFYGRQKQPVSSYIYGSPIMTPMPVHPSTGLMPRRRINYSYPQYRRKLNNSTLVNPVLVNPRIRNSRIVNPTIIRDSRDHRRWKNNSIIIYPGYRN